METKVAVKLSARLHQRLVQKARLEGRSLADQMEREIDVLLCLARQKPGMAYIPEPPPQELLSNHLWITLSSQKLDFLQHLGKNLGFYKTTQICRVLLWTSLENYEQLIAQGCIARGQNMQREELVKILARSAMACQPK